MRLPGTQSTRCRGDRGRQSPRSSGSRSFGHARGTGSGSRQGVVSGNRRRHGRRAWHVTASAGKTRKEQGNAAAAGVTRAAEAEQ